MVSSVSATAERLPGTAFFMVQPIMRPPIQWYNDQFDNVCREHERLVDELSAQLTNVGRVDGFAPDAQKFVDDGIHLTPESMRIFIESTLTSSEALFGSTYTPGDGDEALSMDTSAAQTGAMPNPVTSPDKTQTNARTISVIRA